MRLIIIYFSLFTSLFALDMTAKYNVEYGIFGNVGTTETRTFVDSNNRYKVDLHVQTVGLANFMSGGREEWFLSIGSVNEKGIFMPEVFEKVVKQRVSNINGLDSKWVDEKVTQRYTFAHDSKVVMLEETKQHDGNIVHKESKKAEYYAPYDILSLFLNFPKLLPSLDLKEPVVLYAIGANEKDGRVDVMPLSNASAIRKQFSWPDGHMLKVILNQEIFASERGELIINLGDDGLCKQGVLEDVIFFGDIRGTRVL